MKLTPLLVAAMALAASCGGSHGQPTQTGSSAACHASGATLSIAAKDIRFDADCLAAPAGTPFAVDFDNRDSAVHSVSILSPDTGISLFKGDLVSGPAMVIYTVPAQAAGIYRFHCDIHPQTMFGVFVVEG